LITQEQPPKVSVCVVTYNQEKYIHQCLQSIVDQKTEFDFEIIVSDDCSSDETKAIVQQFTKNYPKVVRSYFHHQNINAFKNFLFVHGKARGEYVAHIDGDDYMLPGKLQAQAEHLESNANTSFAVHAVNVIDSEKIIGNDEQYPIRGSIYDLLRLGTYFVNSSVMYRRREEFAHPDDIEVVDYYLHIERASKGFIYLDRRSFGGYRIHNQGISKNPAYRIRIEKSYEHAFDRALSLDISRTAVESARLRRRMSFAIATYLSGDVVGYKQKIKLNKDQIKLASMKHKILHWTVGYLGLIDIYMTLRLKAGKTFLKF
jgi:glycosyltransferase involved in cell wall biosynthesis